ncbi:MAG: hypothetical protein G01um101470_824 [Parcubacteria group bacterium Gr01-1014_70]|nr:MAG: hypothetical protein G01um101470_824 [Parcubacteria group bacterium Gr01-1014_70]
MFTVALIFYFFFIIGYVAFATALIYHVRMFAIPEDPLHTFVTPFITLSLVLAILSFYFFLRVPWDTFTI